MALATDQLWGTVVAVQANFYQVKLASNCDRKNGIEYLLCTRRTRLKKIGQKVMVGDYVAIEEPDWQDERGAIAKVFARKTELQRPPIANVDLMLLVFAVEEPKLDPWQLSRFLVATESQRLELCLCFNKCDLISESEQKQWQARLANWGYNTVLVSAIQDYGIDSLLSRLKDKITIVVGPSGVGKSSLINKLIPDVDLRVGRVSGKLQRGRHTTRHVELFELPSGGLLADSPGFNQPTINYNPADLALFFPEARSRLANYNCRFSDCLHRDEPNCIVRGDWERYEHYLDFLAQAIAFQKLQQENPDEESRVKLKVKRSGKVSYEPRLASKKYRRLSRKEKHQNLQELYSNCSVTELDEEGNY